MVIFCGSPGAGKSTFYWNVLQPLGYERVNQDILKTVSIDQIECSSTTALCTAHSYLYHPSPSYQPPPLHIRQTAHRNMFQAETLRVFKQRNKCITKAQELLRAGLSVAVGMFRLQGGLQIPYVPGIRFSSLVDVVFTFHTLLNCGDTIPRCWKHGVTWRMHMSMPHSLSVAEDIRHATYCTTSHSIFRCPSLALSSPPFPSSLFCSTIFPRTASENTNCTCNVYPFAHGQIPMSTKHFAFA